jgi:integrase
MNTTEKKFLSPRLYPVNRDMNKMWFIKYATEDFTTGKFKSKKYYGSLNLIADVQQRVSQAEEYIRMMQRGEALPNYQGMKRLVAPQQLNFANAVACCLKYVSDRRNEIEAETISQYKSRINFFAVWLGANNLQQLAIGGITKDHVRSFLNYLKDEKKFANKTYNDYKTLFGTIWQEYVEDGKILHNPWRKIPTLPDNTKHFESYPPHIRQLIAATLPGYDPQLWLFMQTIYYCAIRPHCELRLMKVKHLVAAKQRFYVPKELAKTKVDRVVNIYTGLFEQYKAKGYTTAPPEYYLFTADGCPGEKHVRENYFIDRWNDYKKAHNIPAIYKLYGSKHTGGKSLSLQYNQYVTQEHMGHRSDESTKHYIENIDKDELTFLQLSYPVF